MIILRKGYFMPKMVLCFEENENPEFSQGKYWEERSIPKGWIIDRDLPKPVEKAPEKLEPASLVTPALPATTDGLNITGHPDAFKEGDVIGEQPAIVLKKKPGPKPKEK